VLKHDSWAATAAYTGPAGEKIACKFNRQAPILGLPMRWLGRRLALREAWVLTRLAGHPGMPSAAGPITLAGRPLDHAVAHHYIEGHPLTSREPVGEEFFPQLRRLLDALHALDIAYVDLAKRENIIVGDDGRPYLIDYQISVWLPAAGPGRAWPLRGLVRALQVADDYHLARHWIRHAPDSSPITAEALKGRRPAVLRLAQAVGPRLRGLRRRLLVLAGVRAGRGRAASEAAPEEAVRRAQGR
jgi:hypothetical protein